MRELTYFRGRVALAAMLEGLGVGDGDAVLVQAFTCVAVPDAVLATGASPEFVDIEPGGVNMDVDRLREALMDPQRDKAIKAIVIQHTFGVPARVEEIIELAESCGLPVIEDCCHTFHSRYDDRQVGSRGAGAFYSYEWGKPVVCGVGGSARANDPGLAATIRKSYARYKPPGAVQAAKIEAQLLVFRLIYRPSWYWQVRDAFRKLSESRLLVGSYEPGDLTARFEASAEYAQRASPLVARRIRRAEQEVRTTSNRSLKLAADYRRLLGGRGQVRVPTMPERGREVLARFPLLVADKSAFLAVARQRRVEVAEWYSSPVHPVPVDMSTAYNYQAGSCPEAERRGTELVSLPLGRRVTRTYMDRLDALVRSLDGSPAERPGVSTLDVRVEEVGVCIRDADAQALARLHVAAIPDGFLSSLGERFLMDVYRAVASSDQAFIFVARDQKDAVVGFICGSLNTSRVLRSFVVAKPHALIRAMRSGGVRSAVVKRMLETARYPRRAAATGMPSAEIMNFCVDESHRTLGVGRRLFDHLAERFQLLDVEKFSIVTGAQQTSAQAFYARLGANPAGDFDVHQGQSSLAYTYTP